ncbi:MAG: NUDIX domain-containing protein, partial [bacterium]
MNKKDRYRKNVAIIVVDSDGFILVGERSDIPGQWQLPQGGVDKNESSEDAMWRELKEETGLSYEDVVIKNRSENIRYEYPEAVKLSKKMEGQIQQYFLLEIKPCAKKPVPGAEFNRFRWYDSERIIKNIVDFKKSAYKIAFKQLLGEK